MALAPSWDAGFSPAALALLSAELGARGHSVRAFDLDRDWSRLPPGNRALDEWLEARAKEILASSPRLVGLSVFFSNQAATKALARRIKTLAPEVFVVFGGPSCMDWEGCLQFLRDGAPDAVVFGEGDLVLPALADDLAAGKAKARPGLLLRGDPSSWLARQDPPPDLDLLPFSDFNAIRSGDADLSIKAINTARGCVRRCSFCSDWRDMGFRRMSGRRIRNEFAHQISRHPRRGGFWLSDSIVNSSADELENLCRLLSQEGPAVSWAGMMIVRPDMSPELLALMRRAGCSHIFYGVESASPSVLGRMNKRVPPTLSARVLRDTAAARIETGVSWIVGFPGESEDDFRQSLDFIRANAPSIRRLVPWPCCIHELRPRAREFGFAPDAHFKFWTSQDGKNTFPVRVRRMRQLMETAAACGIQTEFLCYNERVGFEGFEEAMLEPYWSFVASQGSAVKAGG